MKHFTITQTAFIILGIAFLSACSKISNNPKSQNNKPSIDALSVNHGSYNTNVIITGTGFSSAMADNKVFFNGKAATVSAASTTQIITNVPLSAGTGTISVTVNNNTTTGPIFTYDPALVTITLAGNGANYNIVVNGPGADATFFGPADLAIDKSGNIYVTDTNNNLIRKITPDGIVSTFAGNGVWGYANGLGTAASFRHPWGIAIDASDNLFVCDYQNSMIRKITPDGMVSTFAGNGQSGRSDGDAKSATFNGPRGIAIDPSGNLFIGDNGNGEIRKITPQGVVTTPGGGFPFFADSGGLTTDIAGNLYATEKQGNLIYKITPQWKVTTYAGNNTGAQGNFNLPEGITIDKAGNLYVCDSGNGLIKKITPDQAVFTIAGSVESTKPLAFELDGPVASSTFLYPIGIVVDAKGNIFIADGDGYRIREITLK